ncbi:MAG: glycosyltransferase family 2 protein [candidate division WOR-3 bacterium]
MQENSLSIITVNFNGGKYLDYFLKSIILYPPKIPYEVIVVDNFSKDLSFEKIKKKYGNFRNFLFIKSDKNRGYGGGCNLGLKYAKGDIIIFANPDVIIFKDTFEKLIKEINSEEKIGAIGPKLLNPDGSFQPSCRRYPRFKYLLFGRRSFFSKYWKNNPLTKEFMYTNFENLKNGKIPVESIMGAFFITKKKVLEDVGNFDERFFLYAEDTDLCYRMRKKGYKVYYLPEAEVIHYHGKSRKYLGIKSLYLLKKSIYLFFKKHYKLNIFKKILLTLGLISGLFYDHFLKALGKEKI